MAMVVSPPQVFPGAVDVTHRKQSDPVNTPTTLVAGTAANIIAADATATLGRVIKGIANTSATATAYVAYGRVATLTNYDLPLYPGSAVGDIEHNESFVSAISSGTPAIVATVSKYVEI